MKQTNNFHTLSYTHHNAWTTCPPPRDSNQQGNGFDWLIVKREARFFHMLPWPRRCKCLTQCSMDERMDGHTARLIDFLKFCDEMHINFYIFVYCVFVYYSPYWLHQTIHKIWYCSIDLVILPVVYVSLLSQYLQATSVIHISIHYFTKQLTRKNLI